ncbi:hypothetical protein [Flaviaesturariibacter flavus]|uniref:hypothetical protein n=1 Tax=Flaviaesturariibacter flavus TaxID=2502780 RepID=UPI0014053B29|nr:hypothetical protein [Flaviaesturariibacter flavus]
MHNKNEKAQRSNKKQEQQQHPAGKLLEIPPEKTVAHVHAGGDGIIGPAVVVFEGGRCNKKILRRKENPYLACFLLLLATFDPP